MVQSIVQSIIIGAMIVMGIICAVYLIYLKRNGWLGKSTKFVRCPNQDCKGIFQKPIELKDLSESPPRVYPACPECGVDLEPFLAYSDKEGLRMSNESFFDQRKPKLISKVTSTSKKSLKPRFIGGLEIKESLGLSDDAKPQVADNEQDKLLKDNEAPGISFEVIEKPKILAQVPQISCSISEEGAAATSDSEFEVSEEKPANCSHFFGYLHSLPEGTSAPHSCFFCIRMVDCYMYKK